MCNRTEELTVILSKKGKEYILTNATDKCLTIEDYILLSALSLDSRKTKKQRIKSDICDTVPKSRL